VLDDVAKDQAVSVAYVCGNQVIYSWHRSMIELIGYDSQANKRIGRGGFIAMRFGTDGLAEARNKTVRTFLDEDKADWLFWIDTDMGFAPDTVDRLFEAADPVERPVVGALCFSQREDEPDGLGGYRCTATPTVFDWAHVGGQYGWQVRWDLPVNTLTRVGGTGAACVLIHRSVFEKIAAEHGNAWYDRVPNTSTGQLIGEDLSFCLRAGALEIPMFVHTGVPTTHFKSMWLGEEDYWRQAALRHAAQAFGGTQGGDIPAPPPASAETAVIVPVVRRPQNAAPFMESLRASTGMATAYAVCDPEDQATIDAWTAAGAIVLTSPKPLDETGVGTFAQKVNTAARVTDEPWLFVTGDDVRFHAAWLDHAQAAAGDRFHVIGTNDLANSRVTSGQHATHLLVRREYIDRMGSSWDGPGVVCHEGYRHWFVDDEIVTAAKQRGVWQMALGAVVEHLHPLFGKGADDDVYQLGQSHAAEDRGRFEQRCADFL
jgi:hypothetical protein